MEEISGPVIGIALVLSAVFIPTAFIPGITGRLYQQFAVTIAISVILSAFNALTLSPALAALLLQPRTKSRGLLRRFFDWFNRAFARATDGYVRRLGGADSEERHRVRAASCLQRPRRLSSAASCRRAFFPTRTRATCTSICSSPMPRLCSAPKRPLAKSKNCWRGHLASNRPPRHRLQPAQPCPNELQRILFRHAERMGGTAKERGAVSVHQARA